VSLKTSVNSGGMSVDNAVKY